MKKSYKAVVKDGELRLKEETDLPDGTKIELVEKNSEPKKLTEQLANVEFPNGATNDEIATEELIEAKPSAKKLAGNQTQSKESDKKEITAPVTTESEQEGTLDEGNIIEPMSSQYSFEDYNFDKPIMRAIKKVGYKSPTLIQHQAILPIKDKNDVLGIAKTGSGKTAAFALPIPRNGRSTWAGFTPIWRGVFRRCFGNLSDVRRILCPH